MIGWKLPGLLHLLIAVLSLETISQQKTSKGASQRHEKVRFLNPDNLSDVKEFRTRLHGAGLDLAKFLLRILEALPKVWNRVGAGWDALVDPCFAFQAYSRVRTIDLIGQGGKAQVGRQKWELL